MYRHFDEDIARLKDLILEMGGAVEQALEESVQNLLQRNLEKENKVFELEKKINQLQIRIDEACMNLFARQSPLAKDLRLLLAVLKINGELERMGDQSVNIAHNTQHLPKVFSLEPYQMIPKMAAGVQKMVKDSLDAFVSTNQALARDVLNYDDVIDDFKNKILHDMVVIMQQKPALIPDLIELVFIARSLERLGDHATNIAEDVIFIASGQDVRHIHHKGETS